MEPGLCYLVLGLAGTAGFEPANAGTKTRCLTTWPRPIVGKVTDEIIAVFGQELKQTR